MSAINNKLTCPFCNYQLDSVDGGFECLRCGAAVFPGDDEDPLADWESCYTDDVKRRSVKRSCGAAGKQRKKKPAAPLPTERWKLT